MKLTITEIRRLAEFAGLTVDTAGLSAEEMESEITIKDGPDGGFYDSESDGVYEGHLAHFTDYPEEGCCPLGELIAS